MLNTLPDGYRALVLGSTGAIGGALVQALQGDPRCAGVLALSRQPAAGAGTPRVDLREESTLAAAATQLRSQAPFHLMLCATGALHVAGKPPEKRLADLDPVTMAQALALNAVGPALFIKHFHALLPLRERCLLGVLSARVGSIGDNRLGGWYSYRASKAALNMLVRTAAIEVARQRPLAVLAALHPGTVVSPLSAPVIGSTEATSPADAARHLLQVLDGLPSASPGGTTALAGQASAGSASGGFYAWDGSVIPW